ncbi:hypothetical protein MTR67_011752 [Solanum verrucosum]|uniref:Uncharacterized protein n=1 Tax=Solanum verrucosum TaxID=315347 RepID=A0AAF0TFE7_SOLVR|nr:hypothetical protein MTR67_011752 [Solanum verrucosum]
MVELVSSMENLYFLAHVQYFENESATAHAFLYVTSGNSSSQDNKVMCVVYFTMYEMMLVALTPNYHIAPVSWTLVVICCNEDSIDLTLSSQYLDYLKTFYEEMQLDKQRQLLGKLPEIEEEEEEEGEEAGEEAGETGEAEEEEKEKEKKKEKKKENKKENKKQKKIKRKKKTQSLKK